MTRVRENETDFISFFISYRIFLPIVICNHCKYLIYSKEKYFPFVLRACKRPKQAPTRMDVNSASNSMNTRSDVKKYKDCAESEVDIKGQQMHVF